MKRRTVQWLLLWLGLPVQAGVDARNYHQFWLWAAVKPPADLLPLTTTLYVLQGEVSGTGRTAALQMQGVSPVPLAVPEVWLSWRVQRLDWHPTVLPGMLSRLKRWQHRGAHIAGIQIDFDARTLKLADYAAFLRQLKQQLPANCRLSITGLLDWTQTGDVATLNSLQDVVDEIVVQTYRGRRTEPDYGRYLDSLSRLEIPFKVGLVQGGEWDERWQTRLAARPSYRGEVVFLLNPATIKTR